MLAPTLTVETAQKTTWDVAVIGAGPAGAIAARELAKKSLSVLLMDQAAFPRKKLCGCCLNRTALATLEKVGLGNLPYQLNAKPIRELQLFLGQSQRKDPQGLSPFIIPHGTELALSREAFDTVLVQEAIRSGAHFLPEARASLKSRSEIPELRLRMVHEEISVRAQIVIAATGLGNGLLENHNGFKTIVANTSHIGVGTITDSAPDYYAEGITFMAVRPYGYLGLVRLEDGRLNIAGAFSPRFIKDSKGPASAAKNILNETGLPPIQNIENLNWLGKPSLTRRHQSLAAERIFLIGDAASYVEPFTGEGMAWALASGVAVVPFVLRGLKEWQPSLALEWTRHYKKLLGRRQRLCTILTQTLRSPLLTETSLKLFRFFPTLQDSLVKCVNEPIHP